jgi:DNA (cytosine-5)-methyltransferase 1
MSTCPSILKSGARVGQSCGKPSRFGTFCGTHKPKDQPQVVPSERNVPRNDDDDETPIAPNVRECVAIPPGAITFIELCSGCGGLSSGLVKAGLVPLMLNEIEPSAAETLKHNHPGVNVIVGDFRDIDYTSIPTPDVLITGIPCQDWSSAGTRSGIEGKKGSLFIGLVEILKEMKPKMFVIENVVGLTTHKDFKQILEIITIEGSYRIVYQILNANDYGVAQYRRRVIIVGILKCFEKPFRYPTPLEDKPVLADILMNVPPSLDRDFSERLKRFIHEIKQGGNYKSLSPEMLLEYTEGDPNRSMFEKLERMRMDRACNTIMCASRLCHPLEDRPFTTRECARIQSFPDSYEFRGCKTSVYKQIGNAVPVELAYHVGTSIVKWFSQQ